MTLFFAGSPKDSCGERRFASKHDLVRVLLTGVLAIGIACACENETPRDDDATPGSDNQDDVGDASTGTCSSDGCPLALKRTGTAFHAGQLVSDDLSFFCGSGNSEKVTFGVEVECGTVSRPAGTEVVIDALVAWGTTARFTGWQGDCVPDDQTPQRASVVLDAPKTCEAAFDCPETVDGEPVSWNGSRCETNRMKRAECASRLGPQASDTPSQFASRDPRTTPDVPEDIEAWWETGQNCVFECPANPAETQNAINEQMQQQSVTAPWYGYLAGQAACCALCS